MKRKPEKPAKVEEPASPLLKAPAAKASTRQDETGVRYIDDAEAHRLAGKIISERKNLLHRLAQ